MMSNIIQGISFVLGEISGYNQMIKNEVRRQIYEKEQEGTNDK
jgi:hypothetical protein